MEISWQFLGKDGIQAKVVEERKVDINKKIFDEPLPPCRDWYSISNAMPYYLIF